jgi:hypothetical protein
MAKKLNSYVHVHGHGIYGPDDKLPSEVRKLLAGNPRVWADEDDGSDEVASTEEAGQPVRPGPSETAVAGEQVEAAVEAAQEQRDAEHAAAVAAAAEQAGENGGGEQPAPRSTRARRSGGHS